MKADIVLKAKAIKRKRIFAAAIALLFLVYYSWLLWTNLCDVAGGSDSSGYLNYAWRLRHGSLRESIKALDALGLGQEYSPLFRPLGFTWGSESRLMVPSYPPGLPFHMALFAELFGWGKGPFLVSPFAALAALLLLYALSRNLGLSPTLSLSAAIILALFPAFLFIAVQPMSDVLALFWSTAAVLAGCLSRKRNGWAWLAGASFGIGILVRPTNIFILFPLLFAMPVKAKVYGRFLLGGLVFGILQIFLNIALYGTALTSGYRGDIVASLDAQKFLPGLFYYGRWLMTMLTPLVPVAWLGILLNRTVAWRDRLLLLSWLLPFLIFYSLYRPHENWTFLRFLLPALPALILAALLGLRDMLGSLKKIFSPGHSQSRPAQRATLLIPGFVTALLLLVVLTAEISQTRKLKLMDVNEYESVYKLGCLFVKNNLPEKAVVFSAQISGALTYYTNAIPCLWDVLQPGQFSLVRRAAREHGYDVFALLFPFEEEGFQKRVPGRWQKIGAIQFLSLWRLVPGAKTPN